MRASSKIHVEYEVLKYIMDRIDLTELEEKMCPSGDKVADKRFKDGTDTVSNLVNNRVATAVSPVLIALVAFAVVLLIVTALFTGAPKISVVSEQPSTFKSAEIESNVTLANVFGPKEI